MGSYKTGFNDGFEAGLRRAAEIAREQRSIGERASWNDACATIAAAIEAPARDAVREGNRAPHYFQIGGLTGDMCDLCGNHRDSPWHLGVLNLDTPEASGTAREAPSRSSATGSASLTPTEPPPPAWDAETWTVAFQKKWRDQFLNNPLPHHIAAGAYDAGQRAAGVQVPEKMPEWLPELLNKFMWCNSSFADFGIDEPGFYAALRPHLTQTREG
jgi:hypothetical protein